MNDLGDCSQPRTLSKPGSKPPSLEIGHRPYSGGRTRPDQAGPGQASPRTPLPSQRRAQKKKHGRSLLTGAAQGGAERSAPGLPRPLGSVGGTAPAAQAPPAGAAAVTAAEMAALRATRVSGRGGRTLGGHKTRGEARHGTARIGRDRTGPDRTEALPVLAAGGSRAAGKGPRDRRGRRAEAAGPARVPPALSAGRVAGTGRARCAAVPAPL